MRGISLENLSVANPVTENGISPSAYDVRAAVNAWRNETAEGEMRTVIADNILAILEHAAEQLVICAPITTLPALLPPSVTILILDGSTALRDIRHLPAALSTLSAVGCTSLETISSPLPDRIRCLRICYCSSLREIAGELPPRLRQNVFITGCEALNDAQKTFLAYPVEKNGRRDLSRTEILADLRQVEACPQEALTPADKNFSACNFIKANLQNMNLAQWTFEEAIFDEAILENTCLSRAVMTNAELLRIHAKGADFTHATLISAKLSDSICTNVNFRGCKLQKAEMNNTNFTGANFSKVNMRLAEIMQSCFASANLSQAILYHSVLDRSDFTGANMRSVNMTRASIIGTNFTNANLENAVLHNVVFSINNRPIFTGACLKNALLFPGINLQGVVFGKADESPAPPQNAIRIADAWLFVPATWNVIFRDRFLNHTRSSFLLYTIDSIDDKYQEEKVKAAEQLVLVLQRSNVDVFTVYDSLLRVLGKPVYRNSILIQNWLDSFSDIFFDRFTDAFTRNAENIGYGFLLPLAKYFSRNPDRIWTHNSAFVLAAIQGTTVSGHQDNIIHQAYRELYSTYLINDAVRPMTQQSDFGRMDGSGVPEWGNQDAFNWVLLSVPGTAYAIVSSAHHIESMLDPGYNIYWQAFYLYQNGELQNATNYHLEQLFNECFPVFQRPYTQYCVQMQFNRLLNLIPMGVDLKTKFITATKAAVSAIKMTNSASQMQLYEVFNPLLNGWGLQESHIQQIVEAYDLQEAPTKQQAELFFCLGSVFCRYSSSAIFGKEFDSPQILRCYACGLLEAAYQLDPSIFTSAAQMSDIRDRLQGANNAFSCTAILSNMLIGHAIAHFPQQLRILLPPAWR